MEKFAKIISAVAISLILIFGQLPTLRVLAVELPGETEKPTATETTNETEMPAVTEQPGSNEEASESSATNQDETTNSGNQENQESTNEQESTNGQVGETTIETEDINTSGTIENDINTNITGGETGDGSDTQITNENNGTDTDNKGIITIEDQNDTTQENDADINNSLEITGDSGGNSASENVGDSTIETGDVNITGTIVNFANTNATGVTTSEFNIADDQTGDLVLDFAANCTFGCGVYDNDLAINNDGNGSGSTNEGTIEETNSNDITQKNNINVENELILLANTGGNTADNNTGGDNTINTGNANAAGNVINFLNNNILGNVVYGVVNIFGNLIGDIILSEEQLQNLNQNGNTSIGNTGNGTGSNNTGTIDQNEITNIDQLNDVAIINNIEVMADTGGNIATDNTGGNTSITSGDANLDVNVTNIANNNVVGGTWWIVLVNQAGNWFGQILGAPEGQNFASSGADISSSNGTTNISNSGNGSGSTNEGNINQTNENNITQENNATITNNIKLAATTGGNSTSRNTGGNNSITTGDANVMLNLVNFANNNFTGNVVVTVVNVFGSWFGDFVTPGSKQDNNQDNQIGPPPQQEDNTQNSGGNQITDSSGSFHNNSSDNGSPQSSTNPVSAPAPETNTPANPGNTFSQAIVAGLQIKSNNPLELPIVQQTNSEKTSKTKINLAWLLLALPLFALLALAGRKAWMHKNQTEHRLGQ